MKLRMPSMRRPTYGLAALLLGVTVALPYVLAPTANAAQLNSRSIKMSSSAAGASGTTYEVSFTTSATAQSMVIDFCGDSPIIGAACSAPDGFSAASATLATGGDIDGWTITPSTTTIKLTKGGGSDLMAGAATFELQNITNPTDVGSFYARTYTYSNGTYGGYTGPASANLGTNRVDEGGFALSTANQVSVSGTVQETLTFCVSGSTITDCGTTTAPALILGEGTPPTIDGSQVYTGDIFSQISTNAGYGAVIRMKSDTSCGGLSKDGGTTCDLEAIGKTTGSDTDTLSSPLTGNGKFGLKVASSGGTGTLTAQSPYATSAFGLDAQSPGDNVTTTYGDTVASSSSVLDSVNTTYTFGVRASNTTPAGVYTATFSLIATGTY